MKNKCNEGHVMIMTLSLIGVMSAGSTMLLSMVVQKAHFEKQKTSYIQAKLLAEAGVRQTYARIRENPYLMNLPIDDISLNGGTISIAFEHQSADDGVGNIILRSTGKYNGSEVSSAIALACDGDNDPSAIPTTPTMNSNPAFFLFGSAIFCGGKANMTGASYIDLNGGTAHINGSLRMVGSAAFRNNGYVSSSTDISLTGGAKIDGDATAPDISIPGWASTDQFITGAATESEISEQFVELDLQPFYEYAKARDIATDSTTLKKWDAVITDSYLSADELKNGKFTLNACQTLRPNGGVVWIEGKVTLNGSSTVEGCVISTGDIKICGGMTHANANGLPSYMSQSGDVSLQSGCVAYGMLYAHNGDIRIGGNATVMGGAFICPRGDFTHNGSGKILYADSYPYGPNGEDVTLPKLVETIETDVGEIPVPTYMGWIE